MNGHSFGKFMLGLTAGAAAGAALGMTMAPSQRRVKRAAHRAAKHVSEAVETLTDPIRAGSTPPARYLHPVSPNPQSGSSLRPIRRGHKACGFAVYAL